jgi:hypothetical protein
LPQGVVIDVSRVMMTYVFVFGMVRSVILTQNGHRYCDFSDLCLIIFKSVVAGSEILLTGAVHDVSYKMITFDYAFRHGRNRHFDSLRS